MLHTAQFPCKLKKEYELIVNTESESIVLLVYQHGLWHYLFTKNTVLQQHIMNYFFVERISTKTTYGKTVCGLGL